MKVCWSDHRILIFVLVIYTFNYIMIFSPIRGNFSEVGGMLSPMTMRKTVIDRSVVMPRVTSRDKSVLCFLQRLLAAMVRLQWSGLPKLHNLQRKQSAWNDIPLYKVCKQPSHCTAQY